MYTGAVKYTDYAINKFIKEAQQKPWFNNTLFVIVSDHCSKSAGKTDLPVNRYHLPCIIYAPQLVKPAIESRLVSQDRPCPPHHFRPDEPELYQPVFGYDVYHMTQEVNGLSSAPTRIWAMLKMVTGHIISPAKGTAV
ncbi:MAG: sulfatase-like hydrolase/transferase [Chitinophagaceae bacterium]|nr:sulfatase-like hydrolase/transferase [Chitinophagaceae bacterium]